MIRRIVFFVLIVALSATSGYRAVQGIVSGVAFIEGDRLFRAGKDERAIPFLDRAAVGSNRLGALRRSADARVNFWESQVEQRGSIEADRRLLSEAAELYLRCRCVGPASRRSWEGLGEVYDNLERSEREARALEGLEPVADPWMRVGRPGRIALGMTRMALEQAPHWYRLHDKLALTFWAYRLDDEAREAVRASAMVLPFFHRHLYRRIPELPSRMLEEFAEASREALGQVPLLSRRTHLIDLGKLELRIGEPVKAADALRQALESPGDALDRAEARFYLGLALIANGEREPGRARLAEAAEHPAFRNGSLRNLASDAELAGELELALGYLQQLRRDEPRSVEHCLRFAEVARRLAEWPSAIESLKWAALVNPKDPRSQFALVETYLEMGDPSGASALLEELEAWMDGEGELGRLRRKIDRALSER